MNMAAGAAEENCRKGTSMAAGVAGENCRQGIAACQMLPTTKKYEKKPITCSDTPITPGPVCLILNAFNIREKVKTRQEKTTKKSAPNVSGENAAKVAGKNPTKRKQFSRVTMSTDS